MVKTIIGKKVADLDLEHIREKFDRVVIDLGTGDGKFAYEYARTHPETLVIGIDAAKDPIASVSYKATRKPAKGGLQNVVFVWAKAEELPKELKGIADEVYINFPWGSLLSGVVKTETAIMRNLAAICRPGAVIRLYISYDRKFEPETVTELGLPELRLEFLREDLVKAWHTFGFEIEEVEELSGDERAKLVSSWPKKILAQRERQVFYVQARFEKKVSLVHGT